MKKLLALTLALALCLCLGVTAMAADSYTVTIINGMDGTVHETYEVAAGEDFVFSISCAAPCDMGPTADGEEGSGVTTTGGEIAYSNITTGGPNAYPTAETVTISGIEEDITVTVTPNPDETDAEFPTITEGEAEASASGEASGEASDDPYPMFDEYKEYLYETLMEDSFWQGNEASLTEALEAAETPEDESILNFTGSGEVDQAPSGVEFPMTYEAWYAINGEIDIDAAYVEYIHEFLLAELEINSTMTEDQVENEFMPLIEAGDYTTFPAEMLYGGMLESGVAMTYEEFAAQYETAAGGDTSEEAYHAYLKEYVAAVPAVSDEQYLEFEALIDASDYTTMPADMMFDATWWGYAAMTYDEFVEAGGVYEIPAFDPSLTAD
ncbi:MAG: hypothetical protein LUH36_03600 [Oscillospiraceae bacterium]|nr:hypothetical protein [Oscillospiraceae bacterium]